MVGLHSKASDSERAGGTTRTHGPTTQGCGLLAAEETLQTMEGGRTTNPSNRFRQRNLFRTCFHTILGVATVIHAADPQDLFHSVILENLSGGMLIEEQGLIDGMGSHECIIPIGW